MSEHSGERVAPRYPDLAGKVAAVTGGWRESAATCRMRGQRRPVAVNGRSREPIDAIVADFAPPGAEASASRATAQRRGHGGAPAFVDTELGPTDILLAFAGGFASFTPIEQVARARWREVVDANLTSLY